MSQLRTCPHCSRHHRVCEPVCPFCGGALPPCSAASATKPRDRMSRAMMVASGAALLGAAACKSYYPPYGLPPHQPTPDAGTADAAQAEKAGDANAGDEGTQGEDATDGVDR
jgi:hypothetical protein